MFPERAGSEGVVKRAAFLSALALKPPNHFLWTSCYCPLLISRSIAMEASPSIHVVLSDDLMSRLRRVAPEKHVHILWLVAGFVRDTFASGIERSVDGQATATGSGNGG